MKKFSYGRIITKEKLKYFEVAPEVFAAVTPNRGLGWPDAGFITKGKGLVYDTLFDLPHARELKETFIELAGDKPGYVVNSHYNGDHVWGNQLFADSTIIMHEEAPVERLSEDPAHYHDAYIENSHKYGLGAQWIASEFSGLDFSGIKWQDPDILINGNLKIMLDDMEVQVINVAPAHSKSDLLLWLPKERVLFCGDLVFEGGGAVAYSAAGVKLWIKALDYIINDLQPRVVVPGHGGVCDVEEVRRCKEYFEFVLEQVDRFYTDDITALELSKKIDIEDYKLWMQPERIFINVHALMTEKRGIPLYPDWDYYSEQMTVLRQFHNEKYGIRPWDPMASWAE